VLFWHLLTRGEDYAFARQAMTRHKIRRLELLAGAPPQKGRKGVAGGKFMPTSDHLTHIDVTLNRQGTVNKAG
jgi:hypothetical protein